MHKTISAGLVGLLPFLAACVGDADVGEGAGEASAAIISGSMNLQDAACFSPNSDEWRVSQTTALYRPARDTRPCTGFVFSLDDYFITSSKCAPKPGEPLGAASFRYQKAQCEGNPNDLETFFAKTFQADSFAVDPSLGLMVVHLLPDEDGVEPHGAYFPKKLQLEPPVNQQLLIMPQHAWVRGSLTKRIDASFDCKIFNQLLVGTLHSCDSAGSNPNPFEHEESFGAPMFSRSTGKIVAVHTGVRAFSPDEPPTHGTATTIAKALTFLGPFMGNLPQ